MELYLLGRELTKLADASFRRAGATAPPPGLAIVLEDVATHPGSSITEITTRTGFPQSHVSTCVARFKERGMVETRPDLNDGRRTLVHATSSYVRQARRRKTSAIDRAIADALGDADPEVVADVVAALETLAEHLIPDARDRVAPTRKEQ
jgi:DNA-binding MarR family transcriptional regulator